MQIMFLFYLQKRLSCEQKVRVSVSEYEETDTVDDACFVDKTPDIETPSDKSKMMMFGHRVSPDAVPSSPAISRSGGISRASSINEEYIKNEEKRFQEAAEKVQNDNDDNNEIIKLNLDNEIGAEDCYSAECK